MTARVPVDLWPQIAARAGQRANRNGTAVLEVRPNGGQPYTVPAAASRTITPTVPMDYYEIKATVAAVVAGEVEVIEKGVIRGPPQ